MIYLIGIGPGDPELVTVKAARLLRGADAIYVPQSNDEGRSVAEGIITPHLAPNTEGKLRRVEISMRKSRGNGCTGVMEAYPALAAELARESAAGKSVAYVSIGDALLFSTAQYLGRELDALGAAHEYVPGMPAFVAAASHAGFTLAGGREGLFVGVMPESAGELSRLAAAHDSLVLMKINKRLPHLLEYLREERPERAVLLHRLGLDGEAAYELTGGGAAALPDEVGYLSIALIRTGRGRRA